MRTNKSAFRKRRISRRCRGFTIVELMVVIAIIGVLLALLLPAIQSARESARRSQCASHIKQLALAFQLHESSHNFYPTGGQGWMYHMNYEGGVPAVGWKQDGGWGFQILPYIEAQNVWQGGDRDTDLDKSILAISTAHPVMFCPSRRSPEKVVHRDWRYVQNDNSLTALKTFANAKCDYAAADHDTVLVFDDGTLIADKLGVGIVRRKYPDLFETGKFWTKSQDVTDGISNTLAVSEKRLNLALLGEMAADDNEGYTCGWNHDTMRTTGLNPQPDYTDDSSRVFYDKRFGSSHPNGFNAGMLDGSVRSLDYDISRDVFCRLGARADGHIAARTD